LFFSEVIFRPSLRPFLGVERDLFCSRDVLTRRLFDTVREYLSAAISWLNFSREVLAMASETKMTVRRDTFSTKAEECSLFSPVGRKMCGQPHELLGIELWWLPTIDDCSGDVRREPRQAQQGVDVSGRDSFLACDVVNSEPRVLSKASLEVVSATDNSQQAHVDGSAVTGIVYQHFHFAADTLEPDRRHQGHDVIGWIGWFSLLDDQINQGCGENFSKHTSRDVDFDAIGLDLDSADRSPDDCFDCLWSGGVELGGDPFRAFDQLPMSDMHVDVIVNGVEDISPVREECTEPVNDYRFEVARRDPSPT
jgi:hypothetical protein